MHNSIKKKGDGESKEVLLKPSTHMQKVPDVHMGDILHAQIVCEPVPLPTLLMNRPGSDWPPAEDDVLRDAVLRFGESWSSVASCFDGKSDIDCESRWLVIKNLHKKVSCERHQATSEGWMEGLWDSVFRYRRLLLIIYRFARQTTGCLDRG